MSRTDVVIIGGGAAGLFCAFHAARHKLAVRVLEGSNRIGKKILMSGGGRCNFTHLHSTPENFLSANPNFCKSALARYTPYDFVELVEAHDISYVAKTPGQLFCQDSSKQIVRMLGVECERAGVEISTQARVSEVRRHGDGFRVMLQDRCIDTGAVVVASGGLSIPKMGATDIGYRIARDFGLDLLPTRAGLVPFTFSGAVHELMAQLRGVSVDGRVSAGGFSFSDGVLFTHRGLSGPAALQASSYWRETQPIEVALHRKQGLADDLVAAKRSTPRRQIAGVIGALLPRSLAKLWLDAEFPEHASKNLGDLRDEVLRDIAKRLARWRLTPAGTEGYRTAEVTLGGVDTRALSSSTMMVRDVPGLFFIGEVVDVTGHLGGHNFQWAWASGHAAAGGLS